MVDFFIVQNDMFFLVLFLSYLLFFRTIFIPVIFYFKNMNYIKAFMYFYLRSINQRVRYWDRKVRYMECILFSFLLSQLDLLVGIHKRPSYFIFNPINFDKKNLKMRLKRKN